MNKTDSFTGLSIASQALQAFTVRTHLAAHNIANISTAGFLPVSATLADGPRGVGVHVASIQQEKDFLHSNQQTARRSRLETPSGTDLSREITALIENQHGFESNCKTISTHDQLLGYLLEIKA